METILVPTVTELNQSCRDLFGLTRRATLEDQAIQFDFTGCNFLRPDAVAFLGGLARLLEHHGFAVSFNWSSLSAAVAANLAQNGFMDAFGGPKKPWWGNSVPYLHHQERSPAAFSGYLQDQWLGRGWLGISEQLLSLVTSSMGEVYVNAFEHSECPTGVHCCGQFFPKLKILSLTLLDFGVGIPHRVRSYLGSGALSAEQCLRWAFEKGNTTRPNGGAGGLGLDNLCEFIRVNEGSMEFYSHESRATLRKGILSFTRCDEYFHGTMVSVRLRCDDRRYVLSTELSSLNPFAPNQS